MVLLIKKAIYKKWFLVFVLMMIFIQSKTNAATPKPEVLFQKMIQSYQNTDFEGRFTIILRFPMGNQVFEINEIRKAPDKRRIEIISPENFSGTGMVIDGDKSWEIETSKKGHLPFHFLSPDQMEYDRFHNFRLLMKNYNVRVIDGGSVADRNTYLIEINPKMNNRPSRKVWIDAEKSIPLKSELYDAQKMLRRLTTYSKINFNPSIDDRLFQNPRKFWDIRKRPSGPPKGEEVWNYNQGKPNINEIREKIKIDTKIFEQLPGGFALQSINVLKFDKANNVHLIYTDGLTALSVFQSPFREPPGGPPNKGRRREDRPPPPPQSPPPGPEKVEKININGVLCDIIVKGPVTILRWNKSGLYFTLISEIDRKDIVKITSVFIH